MSGDEICDFIWQHQYHKNWVSYSDKENELLNKAVKKRQKTVTLPSKDDKRKILVHLNEMYHINQVSLIDQQIRCLIYNDNFYAWLWKDDDGNWCSYRPHIVFFLEVAYQRKEKTFKFYENADYIIDFETFIQINEKTSHTRCVLREKVDIVLSLKKFSHALRNEEFKNMCLNESLNFEKRCINLPALSSTVCSMSHELQSSNVLNDSLTILENDTNEKYYCNLPADVECSNRDNFHIYCETGSAFSATLSLANIPNNSNKYCIIQLLKHNKKNQYVLWQRLGRVGTKGQNELKNYEGCLFHAKCDFEAKFYDKTKNRWSKKNNFCHFLGKYDLLDVDLSPELEKNDAAVNLDPSVECLLVMICDRKAMGDIMKEMCYDSNNTPLGNLTSKQIKQGYIALNKIAQTTSQDDTGCALVIACDEFYTKIPHNFGKKCLPLIRTQEDIKEKLRMLESLSNIRIATKTMNSKSNAVEHPLNKYYKSLKCELEPLNSSCVEYCALVHYLQNSHGPTHTNYKMEVIDAFKCHQKDKNELNGMDNCILLWHGSRITNWAGILRQGLCIAPPEAPQMGCMFGKGLYFADVSSKSANYCFATKKKNKGLLLLCEVNVGKQLHLTEPDESLPKSLPACYNSILGKGRISPIGYQYGPLSKTAKEPIGKLVEDNTIETCLNYNEYVVYNTNQVQLKYLLMIRFLFK